MRWRYLIVLAIPAMAQADDIEVGQMIYQKWCATCHGIAAEGNGPMANSMVLSPPDLTRLSARHDGVFPLRRVIYRIDGRDPLVSHGSPMPVYGDFFETGPLVALKTETGQPVMTSPAVADLIAWLRSLQVE